MQAVLDMGIDIDFTTLDTPDTTRLENAYGKELASVMKRIKKINVLRIFDEQTINNNIEKNDYDLIINTHGDIDPYYSNSLSKNNAITYCHFPSARFFIESEDKTYLEKHLKIGRMLLPNLVTTTTTTTTTPRIKTGKNNFICYNKPNNFDRKKYLVWLGGAYDGLMRNSTILTNSEYSRKAILDTYGIDDAIVLSPPVDVDTFRNLALSSSSSPPSIDDDDDGREDIILVLSRIDPEKNIENAINFAKTLNENKIGKGMIIAGSLDPYFYGYYNKLKKMVMDLNLNDYITFEIDASFDKLLSVMRRCKAYFHPRSGEHFGMSIVEAMSAGLIPVVPDVGGQTEFVPRKYQFHELNQAAQITSSVFDAFYPDRIAVSNLVTKFSAPNYRRRFQQVVSELLSKSNK
jgi:glycosyltransferase involved in cell wall biosynthesis